MTHQRCETCMSWRQVPGDERPGCHRFPPVHADIVGGMIGPIAANSVAAGLTHVLFRPRSRPDGWCREWEPREES